VKKLFTLLAAILAVTPALSAQSDYGANGSTPNYFSENLSPDMLSANTDQPVIRGQNPTFDDGTGGTPFFDDTGTTFNNGNVNGQQFAQPIVPAQPIYPGQQVDPFLNPQAMYGQQAPGIQAFPGVNGPQPYRFGWTLRAEFEYLADETGDIDGTPGSFESFGLNIEAQNAKPLGASGWVFVNTPNFMWRNVNGIPAPASVEDLFQFGWDMKLVSPSVGGWGMEMAFEPSINTDLSGNLDESFGLNLDGRGALLWQWGPQMTWVGGIMYLDRVDDRILPYGGAVWRPNQLWEFRIMYPESQAKVFMGNYWGWSHWLYARAEFLHSEAYQIETLPGLDTQLQVEDMRATLGWQFDNGVTAGFFEGGWIFERDIEVGRPVGLSGDIDSGFMARAGLRF
jgi:hypothetical protein